MASKIHVVLVDDVDGGSADETVTFALDGTHYEIDLSSDKATKLRKHLGTFIGHARKTRRATRPARSVGTKGGAMATHRSDPAGRENLTAVREWARHNGYEVSDRGRVAGTVLQAYANAH